MPKNRRKSLFASPFISPSKKGKLLENFVQEYVPLTSSPLFLNQLFRQPGEYNMGQNQSFGGKRGDGGDKGEGDKVNAKVFKQSVDLWDIG